MVAMNVWPTDAADGSVANEARWRKMGRHFAATKVCNGVGGELAPSLAFPNLTIKDGACWVDGHFCELTGQQVLTATANGIAVVRFDPAANTAELLWRDGVTVPAQSPTGTFEMLVASIAGSALTDRRLLSAPRFAVWRDTAQTVATDGYADLVWTQRDDPAGLLVGNEFQPPIAGLVQMSWALLGTVGTATGSGWTFYSLLRTQPSAGEWRRGSQVTVTNTTSSQLCSVGSTILQVKPGDRYNLAVQTNCPGNTKSVGSTNRAYCYWEGAYLL